MGQGVEGREEEKWERDGDVSSFPPSFPPAVPVPTRKLESKIKAGLGES